MEYSTHLSVNWTNTVNKFALITLAAFFLSGCIHSRQATEPTELQRTWDAAKVYIPGKDGNTIQLTGKELDKGSFVADADKAWPTIVYMHGCSGIDILSHSTALMLTAKGFAVVQPDSYARKNKPASCKPALYLGGLHRGVLPWRHAEVTNTIQRLRTMPWVDGSRLYLMGLSEGAITTATYSGEPVTARITEGWTCNAGWHEYRGLAAPESEKVLSLLGVDDPWFLSPELRGNCGQFMHKNGSKLVLFKSPHILKDYHYLLWHPSAQRELFSFLEQTSAARNSPVNVVRPGIKETTQ